VDDRLVQGVLRHGAEISPAHIDRGAETPRNLISVTSTRPSRHNQEYAGTECPANRFSTSKTRAINFDDLDATCRILERLRLPRVANFITERSMRLSSTIDPELLSVISLLVRGGRILLPNLIENALFCPPHAVNRIGWLDAASSFGKSSSDSAGPPLFSNGGVGIASRRSKLCYTTPRRAC
jgi:hypothetical protein